MGELKFVELPTLLPFQVVFVILFDAPPRAPNPPVIQLIGVIVQSALVLVHSSPFSGSLRRLVAIADPANIVRILLVVAACVDALPLDGVVSVAGVAGRLSVLASLLFENVVFHEKVEFFVAGSG